MQELKLFGESSEVNRIINLLENNGKCTIKTLEIVGTNKYVATFDL